MLSDWEREQLQVLEEQLTTKWPWRRTLVGQLTSPPMGAGNHASWAGVAVLGAVLVAAGRLLVLDLFIARGVLLLFISIVLWQWAALDSS
jgi:hypothetical protein